MARPNPTPEPVNTLPMSRPDLEHVAMCALRSASIANDLAERALVVDVASQASGYRTLMLTTDQLEDLAFAISETLDRVRALSDRIGNEV